jgi:manganese oxidase
VVLLSAAGTQIEGSSSRRRGRLLVAGCVLAGALAGSVPTQAQVPPQEPEPAAQVCDQPTTSLTLFGADLSGGRVGYGLTPESASVPGPTIEMTEGECLEVTLTNESSRRLSMHAHGVAYTVASDGTPHNKGCVAPGQSKTYVFEAPPPATRADGTIDPGSAGYWHYHDHCMGTPHGTEGIHRGLYGAFIVRREGDPLPDREPFVLVMNNNTFNNKRAPRTPMPTANLGERVEFVVITHGELFHTFHLHGHRWADTRTGLISEESAPSQLLDNRAVGPADSFGFQVVAGEHVGEGAWMYHCHVQGHSDLGMEGLFVVRTAGGEVTPQTEEAIRRWKRIGGHHSSH